MVQINWTKNATLDLKSIYEFIALDSRRFAQIQITKIKARTNILKVNLKSVRIVPEFPNEPFRDLIEGNYRIVYKIVSNERIDIITIHHASRDLYQRKL